MLNNYEVKNAVVEYTQLGVAYTDHGILSFYIGLNYGGSGQGYGQLVLDTYDEAKKKRAPTMLGSSLLLAVDQVFGVDWEKLKGVPCRAYCCHSNVKSIGHYLRDKWMWFDKEAMEFSVTAFDEIKWNE